MKKLVVLYLFILCQPAMARSMADHSEVAPKLRLLDEWIQSQMEYNGPPGLVIGIVHDQDVVWKKAYGYANLEEKTPLQTGSIFRIASHSKLFTSIAVLQLRDQGKLRLDDPITKYLPWFRIKNEHPESPAITIRHLLTHSAGLPRESIHPAWSDFHFPTLRQVRATIAEQETIYPSERRWKYSNLGFSLAGMIVEVVSNRSFKDYVENEIFAPLKMTSSSVGMPSVPLRERLATGYGRKMPDNSRKTMPFVDARAFDPATGISSSVEDMLEFLSWQIAARDGDGNEVLKTNTLYEMQRVHWLREDWKTGWGLGFSISHTKDRDMIGHGGSYPGYRTNTQLSPKEKIGVVVFTNGGDGNPDKYVRKAFEWVAPAIKAAVDEKKKPSETDPAWMKYVGKYRSTWGDTLVLIMNGQLLVLAPQSEDPIQTKGVLVPVGKHTFRLESKGFGPHGELVRFELDADGKVTRLYMGVNYSFRVR